MAMLNNQRVIIVIFHECFFVFIICSMVIFHGLYYLLFFRYHGTLNTVGILGLTHFITVIITATNLDLLRYNHI